MKLETSRNVTKSKRSLHWCRSISKKYLCTFYYSISQKVITLSGRRFITVSGVLLHYRAVITVSGVFYYIIGQLLQYRAFFITLSGSYYSIGRLLHYRLVQQRPRSAKLGCRWRFSSFLPNPLICFECFSNIEWKNEGIISEAKHQQQRRFSEMPSLAEPISGLMKAACYDWPTMTAKLVCHSRKLPKLYL